jgi:hypothetical protein
MHFILFICYFFLACLLISRIGFFRRSIRLPYLLLAFAVHVAAGCLHNFVAWHFYPGHGDIWYYFNESLTMKEALLSHPKQFITGVFSSKGFNLTDSSMPRMDIQYQLIQFLNLLLNFLSSGNLYINTIFISVPVFAGSVALFNTFYKVYGQVLTACAALLLPSTLFFTSVIHKDGLLYMAVGYFFYCLVHCNKPMVRIMLLLCCTILVFLTRTNVLLTLLPAAAFFLLTEKSGMKKGRAVVVIIAACIIACLGLNLVMHGGLVEAVCARQLSFQSLQGGSRLYLPLLQPSLAGFLKVLPPALLNGFFQPLPGAGGKIIYTVFSVELLLVWTCILAGSWRLFRTRDLGMNNFSITCILLALPAMLIIGYMVPFAGALIRYRSIFLPFLLLPFAQLLCSNNNGLFSHLNKQLTGRLLP